MRTDEKKIILVDDHLVVREGLKELIEKLGPYTVSKLYDNGVQLVNDFPLQPEPDLIIMDISMPEMDGEEVVTIMNERNNRTPVLMLTLMEDEDRIIRLFRKGVCGYLKKSCTAAMMKAALEEIFKIGFYHNELMTLALRGDDKSHKKTPQDIILEKLSPREKEFLKLTCHEDEYTYYQIASIMNVQHRTVDAYRESIFSKFEIKSKTGLVLFVLKHNLLDRL